MMKILFSTGKWMFLLYACSWVVAFIPSLGWEYAHQLVAMMALLIFMLVVTMSVVGLAIELIEAMIRVKKPWSNKKIILKHIILKLLSGENKRKNIFYFLFFILALSVPSLNAGVLPELVRNKVLMLFFIGTLIGFVVSIVIELKVRLAQ